MKLMRALIGRKKNSVEPEVLEPEEIPEDALAEFERLDAAYKQKVGGFAMPVARPPKPDLSPPDKEAMYKSNDAVLSNLSAQLVQDKAEVEPFNIWDLVGDLPEASSTNPTAGLFPRAAQSQDVAFPVGWLMVSDGPGRGGCFTLATGTSSIGRGEDLSVHLDLGDASIAAGTHAQIEFNVEKTAFCIDLGAPDVGVLLNGNPLSKATPLKSHDHIMIGDTTLMFLALCNDDFDWAEVPSQTAVRAANA